MPSWNVSHVKGREFELLNGSATAVRCSKSAKPDIPKLLTRMEELGVPASYTVGLSEIYFTRLPGTHGDYLDCRIRLSTDSRTLELIDKVFVHELGHHIDDMEDVTSSDDLKHEKKTRSKHMSDGYARKNVSEYFAVGFEIYYCGTIEEKRKMKKKNPVLFRTISRLHRRFKRL